MLRAIWYVLLTMSGCDVPPTREASELINPLDSGIDEPRSDASANSNTEETDTGSGGDNRMLSEEPAFDAPGCETETWFADDDGDAYGDPLAVTIVCLDSDRPVGYVGNDEDCDDTDAAVNPDAVEICDGADNDCDDASDESDAIGAVTWYADQDGDFQGDAATSQMACDRPSGQWVLNPLDCNDADATIRPGVRETCNGTDDNCDGTVDEDPSDGSSWWPDADGDGYGDSSSLTMACDQPIGYVDDNDDCDDAAAGVNPDADEYCDGIDNDCDYSIDEYDAVDGITLYFDNDSDGYGRKDFTTSGCAATQFWSDNDLDCDDCDYTVYPGATETQDGEDENCDGTIDDGF